MTLFKSGGFVCLRLFQTENLFALRDLIIPITEDHTEKWSHVFWPPCREYQPSIVAFSTDWSRSRSDPEIPASTVL